MKNGKRRRVSKIHLEELRVQTFLSELKSEVAFTVKGGDSGASLGPEGCTIIVYSVASCPSGDSKWPCRNACSTQPSGGGTPSDTSPWSC